MCSIASFCLMCWWALPIILFENKLPKKGQGVLRFVQVYGPILMCSVLSAMGMVPYILTSVLSLTPVPRSAVASIAMSPSSSIYSFGAAKRLMSSANSMSVMVSKLPHPMPLHLGLIKFIMRLTIIFPAVVLNLPPCRNPGYILHGSLVPDAVFICAYISSNSDNMKCTVCRLTSSSTNWSATNSGNIVSTNDGMSTNHIYVQIL